MALSSMTGFARADGEHDDVRWHWEIKSVNGKALDLRFRLPPGFEQLEQQVRELVPRQIRRGNCQISLQVHRDASTAAVRINESVLEQLIEAAEAVGRRDGIEPATADGILALKGVVEMADASDQPADPALLEAMTASFAGALEQLAVFRESEGQRLAAVIEAQIAMIARLTQEADEAAARRPDAVRARLAEQVARLTEASPSLDPDRLHQEAVMIATRIDVQEEIDRLRAHVQAANELLSSKDPVGRKLDFLTQEFMREANTLCSKANDASLTAIGLELKAAIDQIREQVQNIE